MSLDLLPRDRLLYLATPYSKYPAGIWPAYKEAARIAGLLVAQGINVFSPIVHSHPLSAYAGLDPLDWEMWMRVDEPFCRIAHGLIVAKMTGWCESKGVMQEMNTFELAQKPVWFLDLRHMEITQ